MMMMTTVMMMKAMMKMVCDPDYDDDNYNDIQISCVCDIVRTIDIL